MAQDRKDLKIQALLEKISGLVTQYENQAADVRVEVTIISSKLRELESEKEELIKELEVLRAVPAENTEDTV